MIASRPDRRIFAVALVLASGAGALACSSPGGTSLRTAFLPESRFSLQVPDAADQRASRLAAAALVSDREAVERERLRIEALDRILAASEDTRTGLAGVSGDLVNATLDDPRLYRRATRELLDRDDLDPALRARLDETMADDDLELARHRIWDARLLSFGQAFNAVAEPIGKSVMNITMAPFRLGRSLLSLAIARHSQDPLPLQRRQALEHWKRFVARHPYAPEAEELAPQIADAQKRWNETQHRRFLHGAKYALADGNFRMAILHADRALRYAPEEEQATRIRDAAADQLVIQRQLQARTIQATDEQTDVAPWRGRELTVALLRPDGDVEAEARALLEREDGGPLSDEARYVLAMTEGEAGRESPMWKQLDELAAADDAESNMARHAAHLLGDPSENVHGAFLAARSLNRRTRTLWVFVGPYAKGPPRRNLPRPLEWLIDIPAAIQTIGAAPMRLIQLPWTREFPSARLAAARARDYLRRRPDGEYADDMRDWLESFERGRGNAMAALQVAEQSPDADPDDLEDMREDAARQGLRAARKQEQRDVRNTMYRSVTRDYPDTSAGRTAGYLARSEYRESTPQRIEVSRGFFVENPDVAGPQGLGLLPELFDDDPANGELHSTGVALLGARFVEVDLVSESGDPDDPPTPLREEISEERLARFVSKLEETQLENSLVDSDDQIPANAQRDLFFEKARIGLADEVDPRSGAEARFVYRGIRERYGLVRAREAILPFDLVIQGTLNDLSFGAFPRIRPPKETPDAFLYR